MKHYNAILVNGATCLGTFNASGQDVFADRFVKDGGTALDFLMGDGSTINGPFDYYGYWTLRAKNSLNGTIGSSPITSLDAFALKEGSNVTLDWEDDQITINANLVGTGGAVITQDEGVLVDAFATTLNFIGAGVTATDAGGNVTDITISGASAVPNLQQVTDVGNITTLGIYALDFNDLKLFAQIGVDVNNIGIGTNALLNNTGANVVGIGTSALENNNQVGAVGIGYRALRSNSGDKASGFGYQAMRDNVGASSTGIGYSTLQSNSGNYATGIGANALQNNTGDFTVGIGSGALLNNIGPTSIGIGNNSLQENKGTNAIGVGYSSLKFNVGFNIVGVGDYALYNNVGSYTTGLGFKSLEQNEGDNNTALGYLANAVFLEDIANAKNVASTATDVDTTLNRITIISHGFGLNGAYVNLKYTTTGAGIGGLIVNGVTQFKIIDGNIIESTTSIYSTGTDTHTFTPQFVYDNTIVLGANAKPTKSNQVVLGDANVTEVVMGNGDIIYPTSPSSGLSSPLTTKGDVWFYNTADARLPVGNDGETIIADSTSPNGLKWAAGYVPYVGAIADVDLGLWDFYAHDITATGNFNNIVGGPRANNIDDRTYFDDIISMRSGTYITNESAAGTLTFKANGTTIISTVNQNNDFIVISGANNPNYTLDAIKTKYGVKIGRSYASGDAEGAAVTSISTYFNEIANHTSHTGGSTHYTMYLNPSITGTTKHWALYSTTGDVAFNNAKVTIDNLLNITPSATPGSAVAGDIYYDSTTNILRCYNGTIWNDLF